MSAVALGSVALAATLLGWRQQRQGRAQARRRAAVFDDCRALLERATVADRGSDYPALAGRWQGMRVEVQALIDHVGFRKRPSVWLAVTLCTPLPVEGALDVLLRPQNIEFYDPGADWHERIDLPPDWPTEHLAKLDRAGWTPPLAAIREAAAGWLADPTLKQLLVTPRGVRLVVRLCGVDRGAYLVLRSLLPECERVPAELLQRALEGAGRIAGALQ